jgi:guanylate kinase
MMMSNPDTIEDGFGLPEANPLVIVISGPSGVGKDAILNRMKTLRYPFEYVITMTTRARRANEKNQIDYNFISVDEFQALLKNDGLLEWANVYGNYYGVPKKPVKEALSRGRDIIVKVDVQGAANIKKIIPHAVFIFIAPPSVDELSSRLIGRCTENASDLAVRLKVSKDELRQICNFDYVVVNSSNKIDVAIEQIRAIVTAEKCKATPRKIIL